MWIDVELDASLLAQAVHRRFAMQPICFAQDFAPPFQNSVVDRIDVALPGITRAPAAMPVRLADGTTSSVAGHRVRINVDLLIYLTSESMVRDAGINPPQAAELKLGTRFDLTGELSIDGNGAVVGAGIRLEYAGKDVQLPFADLDAQVEANLAMVNEFTPLDFGPLAEVLNQDDVAIQNIAVAFKPSDDRIVIRAEVVTIATGFSWTGFFANPPVRAGNQSWAILIDQSLLTTVAETRFQTEVEGRPDKLEMLVAPDATWHGAWGWPALTVEAEIDAINACPNDLDIAAWISATSSFSLQQTPDGPQILIDTNTSWDAVDSDVVLCALTSIGPVFAWFGLIIGAAGGPLGAAIGSAIGMVIGVTGTVIASGYISPPTDDFVQEDCVPTEEDDDHVRQLCTEALTLPDLPGLGPITPDTLLGLPEGLLLAGDLQVAGFSKSLIVTMTKLEWEQDLRCITKSIETKLAGSVTVTQTGPAPLEICRAEVENDPLGFFQIAATWAGNARQLTVGLDTSQWDSYMANPYPCQLALRTTGGARFADLGIVTEPPPEVSGPELLKMIAESCLKAYHAFWGKHFNPKWLIDPPQDAVVRHRWDVVALGLNPHDFLQLQDRTRVLAIDLADQRGQARVTCVVGPETKLAIARVGRKSGLPPEDRQTLAITQTLLVQVQTLWTRGVPRGLGVIRGRGQKGALVAATKHGLQVWRQGRTTPLILSQLVPRHVNGALRHGQYRTVTFDEDGLITYQIDPGGLLRALTTARIPNVADVISLGGELIVLTTREVIALDHRLEQIARQPFRGGSQLGVAGGRLFIVSPSDEAATPISRSAGGFELQGALELPKQSMVHRGHLRAAPGTTSRLISDSIDVVLKPPAWGDGAVRLGKWLIKPTSTTRELSVYETAKKVAI